MLFENKRKGKGKEKKRKEKKLKGEESMKMGRGYMIDWLIGSYGGCRSITGVTFVLLYRPF